MAIEAFAASLEAIPRILAENAGLNPIDQLLSINAAQAAADDDWIGLDIHTSEICNMADAGIVEPLRITRHAIGGATESAISVLRIDDVLWAKQDAQEPDWQNDEV
jgi:chaperonin GroEL (HSP60 family)